MTATTRGRLLLALPALTDPNFARTVVFMLEHNDEGAFGLVLNRPSGAPLFEDLAAWNPYLAEPDELFVGGPVQRDGFVGLARISGDSVAGPWSSLGNGLGTVDLSASPEELGERLDEVRVFQGYAGWGAGQLDDELDVDAWLVADSTPSDLFTANPGELWRAVLARQRGRVAWLADFPDDVSAN